MLNIRNVNLYNCLRDMVLKVFQSGFKSDSLAGEQSELKGRFEKVINEMRTMKREIKESQNQYNSFEISNAPLKLIKKGKEIDESLIQNLSLKYSRSKRQVQNLKALSL